MDILIVDDAELFLDLQKSYLDRSSFNILTARSGDEALRVIRSKRPSLVILDLLMPGMDGDEVCLKIKSDPLTSTIPVIMVSSVENPELRERCYAAGCDAFVPKPLMKDKLLEAIEETVVIAKRRFPRIPTHLPSDSWHLGQRVQLWIHSISRGGIFLEMDPQAAPGSEMDVAFSLPGVEGRIEATVAVRWQGILREGSPPGVGCEFIEIDDRHVDALENYINEKLAAVGRMKGIT